MTRPGQGPELHGPTSLAAEIVFAFSAILLHWTYEGKANGPRSLSDLGKIGCKRVSAVHISPLSWPIAPL